MQNSSSSVLIPASKSLKLYSVLELISLDYLSSLPVSLTVLSVNDVLSISLTSSVLYVHFLMVKWLSYCYSLV